MIWPFRRGAEAEPTAPEPAGAPAPRVDGEPKPLLDEAWDPLQVLQGAEAGASSFDPSAQPTYGRVRGPRSAPGKAPAPPLRAGIPERPGDGTAGGVVVPGGVLAAGLRPPSPDAGPEAIEAFLHAVRATHRIDSGHLAGVMPRGRAAPSAASTGSVAAPPLQTPRMSAVEPPAPLPLALSARDPVDPLGLPSAVKTGQWYAPGTPIVMARGLVAQSGNRRLGAVDLALSAGERWGLLGANGAGKTTLLRTLAGLQAGILGTLEWAGVGATKLSAADWARHCAFLPTLVPEPFDETVRSRVARIARLAPRVDAALSAMGLAEFADRRWSTLSSGERQRAWVAFALASDADALLLDEPLAHQDPRERLRLADAFAAEAGQGRLIVVTAHDPDWVLGHCSHAMVIAVDGTVVHGTVDRVLQPPILAAAYAVPWRRIMVDGRPALVAGR